MRIASLEVKNFRCFPAFKHIFSHPLTVIEGPNGSGKTSLLEALHYVCYGKSFRTHMATELVQHEAPAFFIKLEIETEEQERNVIQIGLSEESKHIKINNKKITSYKELIQQYRSITISEDDILIIRGSPEYRRNFLDQALIIHNPAAAGTLKLYKRVVKQRTALLMSDNYWNQTSYELWTEQLGKLAHQVTNLRQELLNGLELSVNALIQQFFPDLSPVSLLYKTHAPFSSLAEWIASQSLRERQAQRTLFGPHLDDFELLYAGKSAKTYASRGQQKLLAVLLKVAHFSILSTQQPERQPAVLLDDFMTDFDDRRAFALLDLLRAKEAQLICTVPTQQSPLALYMAEHGAEYLRLL